MKDKLPNPALYTIKKEIEVCGGLLNILAATYTDVSDI